MGTPALACATEGIKANTSVKRKPNDQIRDLFLFFIAPALQGLGEIILAVTVPTANCSLRIAIAPSIPKYSRLTAAPDKLTVWYWSGRIGNLTSSGS
jgi:hypothetical protein